MKAVRLKKSADSSASRDELRELRARLAETEETLRAIHSGQVDAVVVEGKSGPQVFSLQGSEHAYRVLIESMNEGALTLTSDEIILYANKCFANMVKCPLEQVTGGSFRRFLSVQDQGALDALMKQKVKPGRKIQVLLNTCDGSQTPAQISIRPLATGDPNHATLGMVVTDMTAARRTEEMLRALSQHLVQAQEVERGRVALELHDHITQLLCAVLVHSENLVRKISSGNGPARRQAIKLNHLLGEAAQEVERISRNLRPGVLEHLGLVAAVRDANRKFAQRTGVSVKFSCAQMLRLPDEIELTFYRILQEALRNVEKHARARHVTVKLAKQGNIAQLTIKDDGIGFNQHPSSAKIKQKGLGLLSMRERAGYPGGDLKVKSICGAGTEIEARIPLPTRKR